LRWRSCTRPGCLCSTSRSRPSTRFRRRTILQRFVASGGAVVLSSHVMALVEQLCSLASRVAFDATLSMVRTSEQSAREDGRTPVEARRTAPPSDRPRTEHATCSPCSAKSPVPQRRVRSRCSPHTPTQFSTAEPMRVRSCADAPNPATPDVRCRSTSRATASDSASPHSKLRTNLQLKTLA
jgi:hypothetical protein